MAKQALAVVLTVLLAVAAVGCSVGGQTKKPEPAGATRAQRVVVTTDDLAAARACRPGRIGRAVVAYLALANRGDAKAAEAFAPELAPDAAGWYSAAPSPGAKPDAGVTARDRGTLAAYLSQRHAHGERLRLVEIAVRPRKDRFVDVEYKLAGSADDAHAVPAAWNIEGKGAIDCATTRITVWSMSFVGADERTARLCRRPRKTPTTDAVACAPGATARRS